ncbi:hypothetical protein ACOME3_002688 [Neoechinorhynchus agilis]
MKMIPRDMTRLTCSNYPIMSRVVRYGTSKNLRDFATQLNNTDGIARARDILEKVVGDRFSPEQGFALFSDDGKVDHD